MNKLVLLFAVLSFGCGASQQPSTEPEPEEPVAEEPADTAGARSEADCTALLDHIESVVSEAIDREGMMTACVGEWSDEQAACLGAATNDDDVAGCWSSDE